VRRLASCRLLVIFVAVLVAGGPTGAQVKAPAVKRHQATGSIAVSGATQLVLLKTFGRNQARWNFVLNPKTKFEGKLAKGERVRIYYYDDVKGQRVAEQIKILAPASAPVAKAPPAASPTPSQQPH
jgi:hypothetical protein